MFAAHIGPDKGRRNLSAHRTDIDDSSRRMARISLGTQHRQESLRDCEQAYHIHLKLIADIVQRLQHQGPRSRKTRIVD
jgi:hypothetical protein